MAPTTSRSPVPALVPMNVAQARMLGRTLAMLLQRTDESAEIVLWTIDGVVHVGSDNHPGSFRIAPDGDVTEKR